ncbi:unnamed protein product [Adineta steineri]|uniref:YrhK domain-containing protein n=1 Tax=Adineta steineri TaxID=433720 RepID=A0A820BV05_9BILA|nr:unnamed protein product [Adineta steineri]
MYFTNVYRNYKQALDVGAWLFIIGSACFLLDDLQDWFHYRIGILLTLKYGEKDNVDATINHIDKKQKTFFDRYRRIKINLNYLASILGSLLYLVGSVFFLPKFEDKEIVGDILFIVGAAVISLSEGCKIYRFACTSALDSNDTQFHVKNIRHNLQAIFISCFALFGGVFDFIGAILYLPHLNQTDFDENRATALFLCAGVSFTLAGLLLQYRYYYRSRK